MSHSATVVALYKAQRAAERLLENLWPVCHNLSIAGSVRRQCETVNDLEILAVPKFAADASQTLWAVETNQLDRLMDRVAAREFAGLRRRARHQSGRAAAWGPKHKSLALHDHGQWFAVDLFIVTRETWGAQLAIRTGPAEFSKRLVTQASQGGAMPEGWHLDGGRLFSPAGIVPTPTEPDFFQALGIPAWEPSRRSAARLEAFLNSDELLQHSHH